MRRKTWYLFFVLVCFSRSGLFSQTDPNAPFNEALWNGYADKVHLTPKEREEFITAHRKLHESAVAQTTQQPQPNNGRVIGGTNSVFAGPCTNADFELGDMTGWTRTCGHNPSFSVTPGCCPNPNGQQTIMSGAGNDPFGPFPLVYPGGSYSLRLGNSSTGGEADRIEQTFQVSASNANFSYKYAVVFEDPGHTPVQQPYFEIELQDAGGTQIPCTYYYVSAGSGIPGFFNSTTSGVIYKPWTTVLVDLTPYIGQNITIRFSTYDCSLGGHFGYAYIDGVCQSFNSGGSATVCAGASTTFCAPTGVDSYTWNGPGVTNFVAQCATASAPGIYTVTTTLFTGCPGPTFTYTLDNQTAPVASAGPSSTICANNNTVSLSGSITGYSATPVWSSSGSGVFTSSTSINPNYISSATDNAAGSVTLTLSTAGNGACPTATDIVVIPILPSPVVNAGTNQFLCSTAGSINLSGSVTSLSNTGIWTSSGTGAFSPGTTSLNTSYSLTAADIAAGILTFTLTSTNDAPCISVQDTVKMRIRIPATSNAGVNQSLCSISNSVSLSGTIGGGGSTGIWTRSGTGSFTPSNTALSTAYAITAADIASGSVIFTLTSTNNGPCAAVQDTMLMPVIKMATLSAGSNFTVCSTTPTIGLAGTINSQSNTANWNSSSIGTFSPSSSALNTTYSITGADFATGFVNFTLTSINNGTCPAVSSSISVPIRKPAIINAGTNQNICSTTPSIQLSGTIGGGGSTGIWSGGGGVFSPSNTALSTTYAVTAANVSAGSVIFTLTSTNNGPCAAVQDTVLMPIIKMATVSAGANFMVCSTAGTLNLTGTVNSQSNTVLWNSSSIGTFVPSSTVINPTYSITGADLATGFIAFTITSTNNGPCPAMSDSVMVPIKKLAIINAGTSHTICSNNPTIGLSGTMGGGATTVLWSGSGSGSFNPSTTSLNTTYSIAPTDIGAGNVIFTLTSTNNGPCPAVSNTVMTAITKIATVTAGPNLFVCSTAGTLNLAGSINSPSNTGVWSSSGSGTVSPNIAAVNGTYSFSPADISAGSVVLTLISTNNGVCPAINDTVQMRIMKLATVSAGASQSICSSTGTTALNGSVTGASGTGIWTTNGTGAFAPGNSSLTTSYSITAADISAGLVNFTLSSTNNGPCPIVTNTTNVTISPGVTVNAGSNQYICSSQNSIAVSGTVNGVSSTGQWSSSGLGNFSPANTSLAALLLLNSN